jgi:hypothetical protein
MSIYSFSFIDGRRMSLSHSSFLTQHSQPHMQCAANDPMTTIRMQPPAFWKSFSLLHYMIHLSFNMDISRLLLLFLLMKTVCVSTAFLHGARPCSSAPPTTQLNLFSSIENLLFGTKTCCLVLLNKIKRLILLNS